MRRHESLRTRFGLLEGEVVQKIAPVLGLPLPLVDLSALGVAHQSAALGELAQREGHRGFDLSQAPLVRATLVRLDEQEHYLLLTLHHIISDGWSMAILHRELDALYASYGSGRGSELGELPIQYADYACWQREWLQGSVLEDQLGYWKSQLRGAPPTLDLPTDHPRGSHCSYDGGGVRRVLGSRVSEALKELSRVENVTLYMTLLSAFAVLLYRYSGESDVMIGSPIANRPRRETEALIGFFVNTLALRLDVSGEPSFRQLLSRVREVAMGAYAHQDVPFEKVVAELAPERRLSHSPLFQVMFNMLDGNASGRGLGKESGSDPGTSTFEGLTGSKFDLTVYAEDRGEAIHLDFNYATDIFEQQTVARLAESFEILLGAVTSRADHPVSRLPIISRRDLERIEAWRDGGHVQVSGKSLHELIEIQAAATPDALAVARGDQWLTFAALNRRANQVANYLRGHGVCAEVTVGICVERSLEMVIAVLAVLKAGGAYVPIAPSVPLARR